LSGHILLHAESWYIFVRLLVEWHVVAMASSGLYVNPNTGQTQAGLQPFRNAIINGDMRINQRGTSTNLASMTAVGATFGYVVDRWGALRDTYATDSQMAQGTNISASDLPFTEAGITTFARISRIVNTTGTSFIYLNYGLESQDSRKFAGKTITLSFYYRTGANFSASSLYSIISTGKGIDQGIQRGSGLTSQVDINNLLPINLNWSRAKYSVTITDTAVTQLGLQFAYLPTGTAGAADYVDITGVQLELGSVATPFEVRPYPVEMELCQRYYQVIGSGDAYGTFTGTTTATLAYIFKVPMRVIPTPTLPSSINLDHENVGSKVSTSVGTSRSSINTYSFGAGALSGGVVGVWVGLSSGTIPLSAEL